MMATNENRRGAPGLPEEPTTGPPGLPAEGTPGESGLFTARDWLGSPSGSSRVLRWRAFVESAQWGGGVQLHPDVLLDAEASRHELSMVFDHHGAKGQEGCLALFWAKEVRTRPLPIPLPGTTLRGHALLGGHLFGAESEGARGLVMAVTQHLCARRSDLFLFVDVEMNSPLWREIVTPPRRSRALIVQQDEPHCTIRFPPNPTEYLGQRLSADSRRKLRVKLRDAQRRWGCDLQLVRVTRPEDVPSFLERAAPVSARTWQFRRLGKGLTNDAPSSAFFRRIAHLGALRSYLLLCGGRAMAYAVGYQWNGHFDYAETGYDPDFAESSPGELMLWKMIDDLTTVDPVRSVDFGPGRHEFKSRLANEKTTVGSAYLVTRPTAWMLLQLDEVRRAGLRETRAAAKQVAKGLGFWKWLRQRYRT